jgi:hypothetical protein
MKRIANVRSKTNLSVCLMLVHSIQDLKVQRIIKRLILLEVVSAKKRYLLNSNKPLKL